MESNKVVQIHSEQDGRIRLSLQGDLTIRNASALKAAFQEGARRSISIVVELSEVTALDLSAIQLLYAIRGSVARTTVTATLSQSMLELIQRAGFGALFSNLNPSL